MHPANPFSRFAKWTARIAGHPLTFGLAALTILAWMTTGPIFHFSDTWQLVINTGTTIVTFLMVFLIQNSQNRDTIAIHLKLDELLRAVKGAHNELVDIEDLSEKELELIRERYSDLAKRIKKDLRGGKSDTDSPPLDEKKKAAKKP
jgi:low affinity Fe/Cu permease